ncbi:MAG TPA: PhoPQ-activated protein PqaA family protein [Flavitalea sp.]|nr:PhoPQ-activated protein PqaA family protein [Flavitalea sp.]
MYKFLIRFAIVFLIHTGFDAGVQAQTSKGKVTPENALQHYLHNGDTTFHYELKEKYEMPEATAYDLKLTSQKWRQFTWTHQLTLFVPKEHNSDGALLFITGGSVKDGEPNWNGHDDDMFKSMSQIASKNKAVVAVLRQAPNQPLFQDLTEDALISYTLHQFKNDKDYSWPLLFPMVKSAVRAMDAIQQFSKASLHQDVKRFVVSGASKRGWTTWLTGANDKRVVGIAPMVIDILNMPVNLAYQIKAWNEYSIQIEDYVKLGIPQGAKTESGQAINRMIDPYAYRSTLTMPKMIFMGTNDEYWVVDAIKNYYDQIPGRNLICYTPNAGHDLGDKKKALTSLSAFFGMTLAGKTYPACNWTVSTSNKQAKVNVKATPDVLVDAKVWSATSSSMLFTKSEWTSRPIDIKSKELVTTSETFPKEGYKAFYIDLKYKDPNGGEYTQSTRMFVADSKELKLK